MLVKGTQANPYKIKTAADFSLVAKFPEAYFELANDIDFKHMFIMHDKNYCFKGLFNGKGHQIINLKTKKCRRWIIWYFWSACNRSNCAKFNS